MPVIIVADRATDWPFDIPSVEAVDARRYLTDAEFSGRRNVKVLNLCRSFKYQSTGYYVSLLAEARGHKPFPSITTLQDLRSQAIVRYVGEELEEEIQRTLAPLSSEEFELSIYFGRNVAKRYDTLSRELFNMFQAPLLRVRFVKTKSWEIRGVKALGASEVPEPHWPFVIEQAARHFSGRAVSRRKANVARYDLAILHDPQEAHAPSDAAALKKFIKAGESLGVSSELITRDDYARLPEFDALFIRQTTSVNHFTYRFSQRAQREGLVVIDDPVSIARCGNKVYLAELLQRHKLSTPQTLVIHRDNAHLIPERLGFPCVLKKPDSSFSQGVVKIHTAEELQSRLPEFLSESELLVAQEFLSTDFDWRIGIIDERPLYACKYFMARGHWQIIGHGHDGSARYGRFETLPVELAPRKAVQLALKAANFIGDGLYGVDVKESNGKFYVIEVNDNPNIESGVEDEILRDDLYRRIMEVFLRRIETKKAGLREAG
jgi:glutathione synthase/RimK-type ligase-like ATP-grasp enzyme